ncbi:DUF2236 family protein [Mucor ambiguus]|uniref:DUF2236 family protein n=1 Tax=Mucor ambiguus TaxID=91626 RepID=A0A0C9MMG5_9FUNG|nr:DUF2236 family protein [Mucor ambiguus]
METLTQTLGGWIHENSPAALSHVDNLVDKFTNLFKAGGVQNQDKFILTTAAVSIVVLYLATAKHLRYKNINTIRAKYPNPQDVLDSIDIAREINAITTKKEFPFLSREGTELALFKTFTIPTISKLLVATGEFKKDCTRRAEDTELVLMEITDAHTRIQKQVAKDPNTPEEDIKAQWQRPDMALERLNELHGKYNILNDDYLYTLSLFIYEPVSWIDRYEWRSLDEREINAMFRVWYDVGVGMNLQDIPDTPAKMLAFKNNYAEKHITYASSNWKCGEPTFRHLLSNLPAFLRETVYNFGLHILPSVLDSADAKAFQLPEEHAILTAIFKSALHIRAFFIRHFMLPRSTYLSRTPFYPNKEGKFVPEFFYYKPHIYKDGYNISELGPDKFKPEQATATTLKCPVMH